MRSLVEIFFLVETEAFFSNELKLIPNSSRLKIYFLTKNKFIFTLVLVIFSYDNYVLIFSTSSI